MHFKLLCALIGMEALTKQAYQSCAKDFAGKEANSLPHLNLKLHCNESLKLEKKTSKGRGYRENSKIRALRKHITLFLIVEQSGFSFFHQMDVILLESPSANHENRINSSDDKEIMKNKL